MGKYFFIILLLTLKINSFAQSGLAIHKQAGGPVKVNTYLVYDQDSKEAIFIDAGSRFDSLISIVDAQKLNVKYILLTHAHQDHIIGLKMLKEKFPKAMVGFSEEEHKDFMHYSRWRDIYDQKSVAEWQQNPEMESLMDFDYSVGEPDIYLENNQILKIGNINIEIISTPGHTRGSLTFSVTKNLFSGDLILYHSTGYLNCFLSSKNDIMASIQKLYKQFPNETIIYPGHGMGSTIGYEKKNNKIVPSDSVNL